MAAPAAKLSTPIRTRRISWALGAEVEGVDISKPLDAETTAAIRQALADHGLLVFRDCPMTPAEQILFTKRFGDMPFMPSNKRWMHPDFPEEIYLVTNRPRADGSLPETKDTGRQWHHDQSFMAEPAMARVLHCVEVPELGGTTLFANQHLAFETLSDGLKKTLTGLKAIHDYFITKHATDGSRAPFSEWERQNIRTTPHPVVRTHPETGRQCLFISEALVRQFEGWTAEESRGLLAYLFKHQTQPAFTYRHRWSPGETVFWDNRCVMHYAPPDYDTGDLHNPKNWRTMHGTTIRGDKPY